MRKSHPSYNEIFYKAVLSLQSTEECAAFFEDLCTMKEIQSMAQRLVVAQMLSENRVYNEIISETGASTATISRVNRSLLYGNGTYPTVFARLKKEADNV